MNSLLNRELREKRGLVYAVDSSVALMSDCGAIQIYFGCDREHIGKCSHIVTHAIEDLAAKPMKPQLFERIRRQYLGQIEVASSHAESRAMALGKSMLYYGRVLGVADTIAEIRRLEPAALTEVAALIAERQFSTLTLM